MPGTYFKVRSGWQKAGIYVVLLFWLVFTLFPIYYNVVTSFKEHETVYAPRPKFFPFIDFRPSLLGWIHLLGRTAPGEPEYQVMKILGARGVYLRNSVVVAFLSSLITVILGVMAGYALTRFVYRRWRNESIAFFILSQRMFPPVALAMPFFVLFNTLGLLDNVASLVIVYSVMNLPLVTWIVKEFFSDLPRELEEAAMVDGCSRWRALFSVSSPLLSRVLRYPFFSPLFSPGTSSSWR